MYGPVFYQVNRNWSWVLRKGDLQATYAQMGGNRVFSDVDHEGFP